MRIIAFTIVAVLFMACRAGSEFTPATEAQEAGREFIRASLDGDIKKAQFYLLKDEENQFLFSKWKEQYESLTPAEKSAYRNSQIRPIRIEEVNDSLVLYSFSNSYKSNDTTVISIIKQEGNWLVDLKNIH